MPITIGGFSGYETISIFQQHGIIVHRDRIYSYRSGYDLGEYNIKSKDQYIKEGYKSKSMEKTKNDVRKDAHISRNVNPSWTVIPSIQVPFNKHQLVDSDSHNFTQSLQANLRVHTVAIRKKENQLIVSKVTDCVGDKFLLSELKVYKDLVSIDVMSFEQNDHVYSGACTD